MFTLFTCETFLPNAPWLLQEAMQNVFPLCSQSAMRLVLDEFRLFFSYVKVNSTVL